MLNHRVKEIQIIARVVVNGFNRSKGKKFAENNVRVDLTTKGDTARLISEVDYDSRN